MIVTELMNKVDFLLSLSKAALLSTIDLDGFPHSRWMTPRTLKGRLGAFYCLTASESQKIKHIQNNPHVSWMIQTKTLTEIVQLHGKVNILNQPSIKNELLENLGDQLSMVWRVNPNRTDFVVLETILSRGVYCCPMKGLQEIVTFNSGNE
jgi:pyridoxamine 5'-phosphate oxidase